jgi:hypothetical protein
VDAGVFDGVDNVSTGVDRKGRHAFARRAKDKQTIKDNLGFM